jgi:hypothetical protein
LTVKNIARPLHAFALRPAVIAAMPISETAPVLLRNEPVAAVRAPAQPPRL